MPIFTIVENDDDGNWVYQTLAADEDNFWQLINEEGMRFLKGESIGVYFDMWMEQYLDEARDSYTGTSLNHEEPTRLELHQFSCETREVDIPSFFQDEIRFRTPELRRTVMTNTYALVGDSDLFWVTRADSPETAEKYLQSHLRDVVDREESLDGEFKSPLLSFVYSSTEYVDFQELLTDVIGLLKSEVLRFVKI